MPKAAAKTQIKLLQDAITKSPANPRGWMILSDALSTTNSKAAAAALAQSLLLAPYDFWLAGPRAIRAARLWPDLDNYGRNSAMRQTRFLWEEPALRQQIRILLESPEGVALTKRAFVDHGDEMRDLNRWLFVQRLHDAGAQ